jgi:hypothetical protein
MINFTSKARFSLKFSPDGSIAWLTLGTVSKHALAIGSVHKSSDDGWHYKLAHEPEYLSVKEFSSEMSAVDGLLKAIGAKP